MNSQSIFGVKKRFRTERYLAPTNGCVAGVCYDVLSFQRREKVNLLSERVFGYRKFISSSIHSQWICFNEYYKPLLREQRELGQPLLFTNSLFFTLSPRLFVCIFFRIFFFLFRKERKDCGKKCQTVRESVENRNDFLIAS